ncbi:NAD(P)H-dependent glycerol-3-phosphate dehydrogenase [Mollicutes bacterium LVI A0039]|nr:NAD(P)H-dependent glycerol-3-phosphate dehydrogenase [Mollicutes bacterium LVI A0039]
MKVAVLGAGSFGCSIAQVLASNNHEVMLWDFNPENAAKLDQTRVNPFIPNAQIDKSIFITSDLSEVANYDIITYVVPSFALRQTGQKIKDLNADDKVQVICTKGIEAESMKTGLNILQDDLAFRGDVVILSGPTHAEELALKKFTTIVSTCENEQTAKLIQSTFNCDYLRVYTQTDVTGVEILGGAKNVLAIAAGICDSHPELGDNAKAALLTRGLRELTIIGKFEGAKESTFYGLTGMGDLIVTAMSQHSRNRKFGELIGKGLTKDEALAEIKMTVEGIYSVKALYQLANKHDLDLPIVKTIYAVLEEGRTIQDALDVMSDRSLKQE